jgi:hypothetical protein
LIEYEWSLSPLGEGYFDQTEDSMPRPSEP